MESICDHLVALTALFLIRRDHAHRLLQRVLSSIALGFAFLDVPVQVIQALLYNLDHQSWPTNVDFMLLVQGRIGASQLLLKGLLLIAAILYLFGFEWLYQHARQPGKVNR